ncbi:N-acetylglucosamine/diacetylchitobiose ABC transporter substrate-binding protein [Phytomonospora endophytica]|uniref:N-acetylglucosamine transport system substrate-binding protein n=1 Tax=Phytomonospora endophytica TaxID=714109 RepID=A0A841FMK1_9ACTN|nr:N-acetylglucosamine/diacetylchitobiose ABC transporter substrate-binding protein [Phytomonospora endophytica]MBB6033839.1 N-acetylglucosamine transport system substrate-binding protein [Phytomonospora endophytica]GIG64642.1 carbohydrate ABC transporter, N-acetylglucosamine/diacetylchitobiose-binding protein [Phytomonospora endophytica]
MASETTPNEAGDLTRRSVLKTSAALGLLAVPAVGLLSACASGGDDGGDDVEASGDAKNPFGVDPKKPLEVVIFPGGFGKDYAEKQKTVYNTNFPEAVVTINAIEDLRAELAPRFQGKTPPDILQNEGANKIPHGELIANNQYHDLQPLLDAPTLDDPNVKIKDILYPGVVESGTFKTTDGSSKFFVLKYTYSMWGLWYSQQLFDEKKWTVPTTWAELMTLCAQIKKDGVAPFTYTGVHTYYIRDMFVTLACRHGGTDVIKNIDNLEPDAWNHPSVLAAAEALYSLKKQGFILGGSEGLDHRQSQARWVKQDAAFIPVGGWLENEEKDILKKEFEMRLMAVPPLDGSVNPQAINAGAGEGYAVPADGKNVQGGLEWLRVMLSAKGREAFGADAGTPTVVKGAKEGLPLEDKPGLKSMVGLLESNGDFAFQAMIGDWYPQFGDGIWGPALGELMSNAKNAAEFVEACQKGADAIASDDSIEKQKR